MAIAWLLHKGPDIVPIPGTKRVKYLEENVAAASVALDAAQMQVLDEALAPGKVSGPRYNPATMSTIDRHIASSSLNRLCMTSHLVSIRMLDRSSRV